MAEGLGIVHCVLSLDVGGMERVVIDLVRESRRLGQRVAVLCLERPGTLACLAEEAGARVIGLDKPPGLRPGLVRGLARAIRSLGPDVVHTHQVGALAYAGPAAAVAGRPLVVHTEHGKHYARRRRTRVLGRLAGTLTSRFFCVSKDIAAEAEAAGVVPARKIRVVPNGIDTDRFRAGSGASVVRAELGIPPDAPLIGTIGRLNEVKRQDRLINGFARLLGRRHDAHLVLVGDGPLREELTGLADRLGVGHRVHFVGYQDRPERFLSAFDVFALTSRSEGMPLSVLEAWAAGVPVVASRVGGLPELIEDGRNGLLFDQDDEAALTAALDTLVADPGLSRRIGEAARHEVIARFDVRVMSDAYESQYRELLGRKGPCS